PRGVPCTEPSAGDGRSPHPGVSMSSQPQRPGDGPSSWAAGRWLVALLVLLVTLGILLPLAIDALRDVVALTN
ncbi:MAG: hypothetical protein WD041_01630, partial [Nitriliruptoraceae bacterium]